MVLAVFIYVMISAARGTNIKARYIWLKGKDIVFGITVDAENKLV